MKKTIALLAALIMLLALCSCGRTPAGTETSATETAGQETAVQETGEWTREGYFTDEDGKPVKVKEATHATD